MTSKFRFTMNLWRQNGIAEVRWVTLSSTPSRVCVCHRWARLCEVLLLRFFPPQDEAGMIRPDCAEYCVFLRGTSSSDRFFEFIHRQTHSPITYVWFILHPLIWYIHSSRSKDYTRCMSINPLLFQMSLMHFKWWEFWGSSAQKDRNKSFQTMKMCYK